MNKTRLNNLNFLVFDPDKISKNSALKIIDEIAKSGAKLKILKVQLLVKTIIKRIKYFNLLY